MTARAKRPVPRRRDRPPSPCTRTRPRPQPGQSFLQTQPTRSRHPSLAARARANVFLDPATLKRAQAILGRRSESEAIREALELVAFRTKVMKGYDRAAGKGRGFGDVWQRR